MLQLRAAIGMHGCMAIAAVHAIML
eukprot:SAG31_NODE_33543_length_342_cov_1.271605_1_plen_24_part_10